MDPTLDYEEARRELLRGRALVSQLKATLERTSSDRDTVDVLMEEISRVLTRALAALNFNEARNIDGAQHASPNPNIASWSSSLRTRDVRVQKILSTKPFEDGYSWKKYGQKTISGYENPRSYFQCYLRREQGCMALKQVQQSERDPAKFLVTYIGQHTCTAGTDAFNFPPDQCFLSFGTDDGSYCEQVQNCSVGTSNMASDMMLLANPNPSDSDLMVSLLNQSGAVCCYYDENTKM